MFTRPDSRPVPVVPPPQSGDRTDLHDEIRSLHETLDLSIDAGTGVTNWLGESMDYGLAVEALMSADGRQIN